MANDALEALTSEVIAAQQLEHGVEPAYEEGEKVFAFHQNMLYEAKVLKKEERPRENATGPGEMAMSYFIHYQGWKDRWDEWVGTERILKYTDANKEFQRRMREEKSARKRRQRSPSASAARPPVRPPKRRRVTSKGRTRPLPTALQELLLADHTHIHAQRLACVPAKPSITDILVVYADEKLKAQSPVHTSVLDGIQLYFEKALGTLLLYRFEKLQYRQLLERQRKLAGSATAPIPPHARFSHLYGAPHLLRLLCKMPELLDSASLEQEARDLIMQHVEDLIRFLDTHVATVFDTKGYAAASESYKEASAV